MLRNKDFSCFQTLRRIYHVYKCSNVNMYEHDEMPIIVDILTFMSMINLMLGRAEHEKRLIALGPGQYQYADIVHTLC